MFPNTVAGVLEALETSFGKNIYADKVIERLLKVNKKWGSRDRSFVAEHTYEIIRWWRLLWALLDEEPTLKRKKLWNLFGVYWKWRGFELPDWDKFDQIRDINIEERLKELHGTGITQSFPEWFDQRASAELGDAWNEIAMGLNQPTEVVVRTNTLVTTREALMQAFEEAGIPCSPLEFNNEGIILHQRANLMKLNAFVEGHFEVQDGGSQRIAPLLGVKPGMRVIDACAGAGGKTLQMAAQMMDRGEIISLDVEAFKLGELEKRAKRNHVNIVRTVPIKSNKTFDQFEEWADCLLLDVPCSGSGVIRRDVDTKWKLQEEHVESLTRIQRDILKHYTKVVKPGGHFVYATCSIFKSENEDQVAWFKENFEDFECIEEHRINPANGSDAFYMSLFKRKN